MGGEQAFHRHDHAGGAETALEGLMLEKSLLYRIELAVSGETLDGRDLFVLDIARQSEAGTDRLAVDENGTGATDADAATFNRSFKFKIIAQKLQKRSVGADPDLLAHAIYGRRKRELHGKCFNGVTPASSS
jgi:hypothetical protein